MKKVFLSIIAAVTGAVSWAQVVTTSPAILHENSENVVITYHADQGNEQLKDLQSTAEIFAHIGVVTNNSVDSCDWKYSSEWGDNSDKYKLTYESADTWTLDMGDIRTYFGITDETETVKQIGLVFRTGDMPVDSVGDSIFIDLHPALKISLTSDNVNDFLTETTNEATLTVTASEVCKIELFLNDTIAPPLASAEGEILTHAHKFTETGTFDVIARATCGSDTVSQSLTFRYPKKSEQGDYPGGVPKMGTVKNEDGSVTFCIAAPGKSSVMIIPAWDDYKALDKNAMKYQDYEGNRYFWTTVSGLDETVAYPYFYVVDAKYKIGDPYAKLVLDPLNDVNISSEAYPDMIPHPAGYMKDVALAVYKGDIDEYSWNVTDFQGPEASDLIIYEMLLRDFTGTEGEAKGDGTVRKAIEKIPYLKDLGVNAVELMPIMEFGGNNSWGYNTNFYFAPDKAYGTHDDYREFIDVCHENEIAVILDIAFNQSDSLHPWFQMYPIAENPFYNETAPHDGGVLNDWKQDNQLVQQQWKDVLQYWLKEFKVDGFRFDFVKGLGDNGSYGKGTDVYNQSRVDRMKALHSYITEINPYAYHINGNFADAKEENAMGTDGQINQTSVNDASGQFVEATQSGSNTSRFLATNDSRDWGTTVSYAESHNEERLGYITLTEGFEYINENKKFRMHRLGSLAAQMILTPGAHMIWQFGELGNEQSAMIDGNVSTDPKTVSWDHLNDIDRSELLRSYSELCRLRRENPELFTQEAAANMIMKCAISNWISGGRHIKLSNGDKELICVINPSTSIPKRTYSGISFNVNDNNNYIIVSKSYDTEPSFDASAGTVKLQGNSYVVIMSNNAAGVDEDVIAEYNAARVYGGQGEIVVEGRYNIIKVYSITGREYNSLYVPAGLYIVNVDGRVHKVIVK